MDLFDGQTSQWIRNWLESCTQKSCDQWLSLQVEIRDVPRVLLFRLMLCSTAMFVDDRDSGIEPTLNEFPDDTRLCGAGDMMEGRDTIQSDLGRLERWDCVNIMKSSKDK